VPQYSELDLNVFTDTPEELRRELNDRIQNREDFHRDAEVEGLDVYMGPNGYSTKPRFQSVTGDTTLDATDSVVSVDTTSAAVTITLPAAADSSGVHYYIGKINSGSNAVTIDANGSETIIGQLTIVFTLQWMDLHLYCNGTSWRIL